MGTRTPWRRPSLSLVSLCATLKTVGAGLFLVSSVICSRGTVRASFFPVKKQASKRSKSLPARDLNRGKKTKGFAVYVNKHRKTLDTFSGPEQVYSYFNLHLLYTVLLPCSCSDGGGYPLENGEKREKEPDRTLPSSFWFWVHINIFPPS